MKEWTLWGLWWLLFGSAAISILIGGVKYWLDRGVAPGTVPEWVQAIGSILAVASGFLVVGWQKHHADKAAMRDQRIRRQELLSSKCDYHERAFYVAAHASGACGRLVHFRMDTPNCLYAQFEVYQRMIDKAVVETDRISIVDFGNSRTVDAWLGFKRELYIFRNRTDERTDSGGLAKGVELSWHLNTLLKSVDLLNGAVLDYRNQNISDDDVKG